MRKNLGRIGVDNVTPHDLRRTAASRMTEMGIPRLVVCKILGHFDGSITGVYDRFEYWPQKKHALDAWAARLQEIVDRCYLFRTDETLPMTRKGSANQAGINIFGQRR